MSATVASQNEHGPIFRARQDIRNVLPVIRSKLNHIRETGSWKEYALYAGIAVTVLPFTFQIIGAALLALELYAFAAHLFAFFGYRVLPSELIKRKREYLVLDALGVLACLLLPGRMWWLATVFHAQQLYILFTWGKSRVLNQEHTQSQAVCPHCHHTANLWKEYDVGGDMKEEIISAFNIASHALYAYIIARYIYNPRILLTNIITQKSFVESICITRFSDDMCSWSPRSTHTTQTGNETTSSPRRRACRYAICTSH